MTAPQQVSDISPEVWSERLFQRLKSQPFPLNAQWEITCRCNLKCVMCYTDCFNTPQRIREELSTDELLRILHELHETGCLELIFTGGEPLSRRDFMTIYEEAHRLGFLITVFTNGTLITRTIADRWAKARPKSVEISLHGMSRCAFDEVTQISGSRDRCMEAIQLLVDRKIPLVLKTVGLSTNREEILAIKQYADALGPDVTWRFGQHLRDDLTKTGAPFQYQLSEDDLRAILEQDSKIWEAKCEEVARNSDGVPKKCGGGDFKFHIDAYGQLQLCSNNRRAGYDLRQGSFREGFYELLPTFPCPRRLTQGSAICKC